MDGNRPKPSQTLRESHKIRPLITPGAFSVATVVASLLPAPRLRRSPPTCPRTVRLRRCRSLQDSSPTKQDGTNGVFVSCLGGRIGVQSITCHIALCVAAVSL